jgi:serpin B
VILPAEGAFEAVEQSLDAVSYQTIWQGLQGRTVDLFLPRFEYEFQASLPDPLKELGMTDAFNPDIADFSGMIGADNPDRLVISDVIHKAFIKVEEEGTEAAAATAVIMEITSAPMPQEPVTFRADRPFMYVIYDHATGAILFMGRVVDPS